MSEYLFFCPTHQIIGLDQVNSDTFFDEDGFYLIDRCGVRVEEADHNTKTITARCRLTVKRTSPIGAFLAEYQPEIES